MFFPLVPGTVGGLIPWLITGWQLILGWPLALRVIGAVVIVVGLALLVAAFAQFVYEGRGTPAPVAPTEQLVIHGLYRFVRNPMYLAMGAVLIGQALLFPSLGVLILGSRVRGRRGDLRQALRGADPAATLRGAVRRLLRCSARLAAAAQTVATGVAGCSALPR